MPRSYDMWNSSLKTPEKGVFCCLCKNFFNAKHILVECSYLNYITLCMCSKKQINGFFLSVTCCTKHPTQVFPGFCLSECELCELALSITTH